MCFPQASRINTATDRHPIFHTVTLYLFKLFPSASLHNIQPHSEQSPHVYLLLPTHLNPAVIPHFYESRHPIIHNFTPQMHVHATSICHAPSHWPHSEHLEKSKAGHWSSDCYKSTLGLLSFNDTPPIHFTIILYALQTADFQPSLIMSQPCKLP